MDRLFTLVQDKKGFLLSASDRGKSYIVYTSDSSEFFEKNAPVQFTDEVILDWKSDSRPFCHIFWDDCYTVVSIQEIKAGDTYNLRDLGGYLTSSQDAVVKFGLIYRSDQPSSMGTDAERVYKELGLKSVLDFRGSFEHRMWPDPEIEGITNYWLPAQEENPTAPPEHVVVPNIADIFKHDDQWKAEDTIRFSESYLAMPFNNPAYKNMFTCMLNDEVPALIHCLAGKDRTGIGAMLFLLALGVSEDTIMKDYTHRSAAYQAYIDFRENELQEHLKTDISRKHFGYFFGVLEENLAGSLNKIRQLYVTPEIFFKESYDLGPDELKQLRAKYLLPLEQ